MTQTPPHFDPPPQPTPPQPQQQPGPGSQWAPYPDGGLQQQWYPGAPGAGPYVYAPRPPQPKGIAIAALAVGIVAVLTGLVPFAGVLLGGAAVALGIIACVKRQPKGLGVTGLVLGAVGCLTSLMMTVAIGVGLGVFSASLEGVTSGASPLVPGTPSPTPAPEQTPADPDVPAPEDDADLTEEQAEAARTARQHLEFSAHSRDDLIGLLEFEGFTARDAEVAVDALNVDWNEQAVQRAKSYLKSGEFTRDSLLRQLEFEGFTRAQAEHGVAGSGL